MRVKSRVVDRMSLDIMLRKSDFCPGGKRGGLTKFIFGNDHSDNSSGISRFYGARCIYNLVGGVISLGKK